MAELCPPHSKPRSAACSSTSVTAEAALTSQSQNRQSIKVFAGEGLFELSRFVTEARFLIASLSRLAERLETDPAQFLFGDTEQGFEAE